MKDWNVEFFFETIFDLETTWRRDVFQVNAAESSRDRLDSAHDLIRIFSVQTDRKRIDASEFFKQHRFAFHHRHRRCWTNVTKTEHRRAVCHDCDSVLLDR